MSKFKIEYKRLKRSECNFAFYKTSGVWGMFCRQTRHYWFCVPFLIGFRRTVSWGGDFESF